MLNTHTHANLYTYLYIHTTFTHIKTSERSVELNPSTNLSSLIKKVYALRTKGRRLAKGRPMWWWGLTKVPVHTCHIVCMWDGCVRRLRCNIYTLFCYACTNIVFGIGFIWLLSYTTTIDVCKIHCAFISRTSAKRLPIWTIFRERTECYEWDNVHLMPAWYNIFML